MKIRHIFFDLDNTLWDHRKNAYLTIKDLFFAEKINDRFPIDFEDFYAKYDQINEKLWEQIRDGEIDKDYLRKHRFYDTFLFFGVDDAALAIYFETHFLDEISKYNILVDGAEDILEYLRLKQYKMHIISNGFQEVTERKAQLSGISKYFETITSADSVGVRKPNPKIFEYSLSLGQADKHESILIGDDLIADVKGAQSFGMDVIFYDALGESKNETETKAVQNLVELKNYL